MAYSTPPARTNGETIAQTWFNILRSNFEDHEARVLDLENEFFYWHMKAAGALENFSLPADGVLVVPIEEDVVIVDAEFSVIGAGVSGSYEIDIEYKSGSDPWQTIFSTKPTVDYTAGDNAKSTNGVVNSNFDELAAGDLLRLNIDAVQAQGKGIVARLTVQRN